MRNLILACCVILFTIVSCSTQTDYKTVEKFDKNGFKYETVENDPLHMRVYTLKNGLKVYLSVNKDKPRIQTFIGVRAGSSYDPPQTTGLAHYLEHMMFKGSDSIACLDWSKEAPLIDSITSLYQQHLKASSQEEKNAIYARIDSFSQMASKYCVPNEYDKMVTSLGAKGTNAYTSVERTVYTNDIPSNELNKWLRLESERFRKLVLRLFQTELEAVYEEYNMHQDEDYSKVDDSLNAGLFRGHPYGTQTTIGVGEQLKNPSMINIMKYWKTYYVPNNMAICLSGDLDPDETIKLINKYWGDKKPGKLPELQFPKVTAIEKPIIKEVVGPQEESVSIGFLFNGFKSDDRKYCTMIDYMLNNSQAGLIDLDLIQKQKVLSAGSYTNFLRQYGSHILYGKARQGQTLEQVKDLLLNELNKIKKGDFDDWLMEAVVNQFRLSRMQSFESNYIAQQYINDFIMNYSWADYLKFIDDLGKISKADLVKFAKEHYKNNYVVVYKRTGKDTTIQKIQKPKITPIDINRSEDSRFYNNFMKVQPPDIKPVFVDFKKSIENGKLKSGVPISYIKNPSNPLFRLVYIIDMGKDNIKMLPIAVNYLKYIGTDKYSPEDLRKELYRYGLSFNVYAGSRRTYVLISGLEKYLDKADQLLEHILSHAKPDKKIYDDYVKGIIKKREDAKLNKWNILYGGLFSYGKYGKLSDFTNIYSADELRNIKPEDLTNLIKSLYSYKHKIFYYGQKSLADVIPVIDKYHKIPAELKDYPKPIDYPELPTDANKVYFVNYDMVQANIIILRKDVLFDKTLYPYAQLFNEYFGSGLSSIVFQEVREGKGLAYSAYSDYSMPSRKEESDYCYSFLATQADKMKDAVGVMMGLMQKMPRADVQFNSSRESIIKKIESGRIIKQNIYWQYLYNQDMGIDSDIRQEVYNKMKNINFDDLESFYNNHIKGKYYTFLVIGDKTKLDMNYLKKLGTFQELSLKDVFGY